jgi:drug/metabolite transporter (DMT)-like permease
VAPLIYSLASAASWGVSDFLGGLQTRRLPVLGVLAVSQPAGLVLIAVFIAFAGADSISAGKLAIAFLAGAASLGGLAAFYSAMAMGTVSVVAPIAALGVVVPVIFGLAEGESPDALQLAGLVPAIAGVVVLSYEERPEEAEKARTARLSIALAIASTKGVLPVVAVISSMYPAFTVALAHAVLGERLATLQWTGVFLALGGVAMIAAGS